jgi:P4 family phage/plasmid primase-like protien
MAELLAADPDDLEGEDKVIATLAKLSKAHGAESRAADIVCEKVLRGRFRFSPSLEWLEWDGRRWDTTDVAKHRVREVIRQFVDETERDYRVQQAEAEERAKSIAAAIVGRLSAEQRKGADGKDIAVSDLIAIYQTKEEQDELEQAAAEAESAKAQADIWMNLLSNAKINSLVSLCTGMDGVLTRAADLDNYPDLLNCHNGVVDLHTGELHPHDPDLLLTHLAGGAYDPTATHPRWTQALQAVPLDTVEWLQVRLGQSMTGHTPEDDSLVVAAGGGENGKSAIMSAMIRAAGTYGRLISHRVLMAEPGQHPTELMTLRGLRFALLEETPEEGHLDTHQLKVTIGTPQITARHMRKDDVTFDTTHSLWINTNYLPQVDTTDHGTWRRLKVCPFPFRFLKPGQEPREAHERVGDTSLKPALKQEDGIPEAVLAWVVAGAMRWYQNERQALADTDRVEEAIEGWRAQSDVAYLFATEYLVREPGWFITGEQMRKAFGEFLEEQGKRPWSAKTLNGRLPDAMTAAGCQADTDPGTSVRVREGESPSKWNESPHAGSWGPEWHAAQEGPTLNPGDKARIWRGVRFATTSERRTGATGLKAV